MTRRYNVAGQLVQQVEKDNRGELISQFDFSYDAAGNLLKEQKLPKPESVSLSPVTMTYSAANRLATYNEQAVQFDADGNLVVGPLTGEMANFWFDSRNRLVSAGETSYRYDAENQRIGVNQTSYVVNSQPALSQVLVKEENGVKTFYVYGLGLLGEEKEGEYRSYHFDFRGSTVALTDKTGKVVQRFQYGPYGELLKGEASVTPFLFNGKFGVMTDDNGLYYMRAGFYSAAIKRFVNQNVLLGNIAEGQTLNRYAFVTGRPVSLVDPFGLEGESSIDEPEFLESLIPFWGSGKATISYFQKGQWGWGVVFAGMTITDVALIKTLVTASIKGTIKISANLATSQLGEQALLHGSGPVAGVIEASSRVKSVKALLNYFPKEGGIEFVFDPKKNIFVVGKPKNPVACSLTGSPHEQLARSIGADESVVVGGIFSRGADGRILTNEQSGHFFQNWTPAIREQFIRVMKELGVNIEHSP